MTKIKVKSRNDYSASKKKKSNGTAVGFLVFFVLLICAYGVATYCFMQRFIPGTTFNNTDVSFMTAEQARAAISKNLDYYTLTILEQNGKEEKIESDDIALSVSVSEDFDKKLDIMYGLEWIINIFQDNNSELENELVIYDYDENMLDDIVETLDCASPDVPVKAKNAEIALVDDKFAIVPEQMGNVVDKNTLTDKIKDAILSHNETIDLVKENMYELPEIYSDDPVIQEQWQLYNEINGIEINLKFGGKVVPIGTKKIAGWIKLGKNPDGSYRINIITDEIKKYVKTLAETYDTYGKPITLTSHSGTVVNLTTGDYGWYLDQPYVVDMLKNYVINRESKTINLTDGSEESNAWWYRYVGRYSDVGSDFYGGTYIEVSVPEQHMWYYKEGKIVFESDVVTGNPNLGNSTPHGAFRVRYHYAPATLRGPGYETQVAYWMVFADDVGFHDATWQPYFGGSLYLSNGSHGCVNMPLDKAGQLFEIIEDGTPVFVY